MLFSEKNTQINLQFLHLKIGDKNVEQVGSKCNEKYFKFVGHVLDDKFTWVGHVEHICKKLSSANYAINSTKNLLPTKVRKTLYYSLFDSHLNFGNLLWGCAANKFLNKIENLQKICVRNVALTHFKAHTEPIYKKLSILKFSDKLSYCNSIFMHKYRNKKLPESFTNLFIDITCTDNLQTRHNDFNYVNHPALKNSLEKFPFKSMIKTWNALDIDLKSTADEKEFIELLKESYLSKYCSENFCIGPCFSCNTLE